jgi:hypothetical protein
MRSQERSFKKACSYCVVWRIGGQKSHPESHRVRGDALKYRIYSAMQHLINRDHTQSSAAPQVLPIILGFFQALSGIWFEAVEAKLAKAT